MTTDSPYAAASAPRLALRRVSKSFGAVHAVRDASLEVAAGEIHALCGHNGAGKSTVVKMIAGQHAPDGGELLLDGTAVTLGSPRAAQSAGIAVVDQELSVIETLSVSDNLLIGSVDRTFVNRPRESARRAAELLAVVGLDRVAPSSLAGELSLGERQLLEIARAVGREARVIVLDEPTATLSQHEIEKVHAAARAAATRGCAILYISHRLGEVLDLCDRVTVMRDGESVRSSSTAGLGVDELITAMLGEEASRTLADRAPRTELDRVDQVLTIWDLTVPHHVEGFSLEARSGRIYGLAGQVGSGAAEVLRALAGLEPDSSANVTLGGKPLRLGAPTSMARAGLAYLSGDRKGEGLFLDSTVADNLVATRLGFFTAQGVVRRSRLGAAAAALAAEVTIDAKRLRSKVGLLSGGNQQKAFIGRSLQRDDVSVLLLDEPTRGVDVGGRGAIHEILRRAAEGGSIVVFASTELDELLDVADEVLTMFEGRVVQHYTSTPTAARILADITHRTERV